MGEIKNNNWSLLLHATDGTQIAVYTDFGKQFKKYVSVALMIWQIFTVYALVLKKKKLHMKDMYSFYFYKNVYIYLDMAKSI